MPKIRLHNDNEQILAVWVEPIGEDFWMRPKEQFTISTDATADADPDEAPFEVVLHAKGVSVFQSTGHEAVVRDQSGTEVACGHQRPLEVLRAWTESAEAAVQRTAGSSPTVREMTREHAEFMRRELTRAEATMQAQERRSSP
ncbi:hypothetical protein [Streptomyces sp. NPDC051561]|uniref:hypothetical protein n=1 Tax=Streptomyces sp. NPDC051561 TaxID=3365658 RepID=UPI0037B9B689